MERLGADNIKNLWAALDLGSNSFHLLLAEPRGYGFIVHERLKEKVQLLAGLENGRLSVDARARGRRCLERFSQRLTSVPPEQLIIMGTSALRQAKDGEEFAHLASGIFATRTRIISGDEEARLIYKAVAHQRSTESGRKLVIDIGGGSTEFALGAEQDAQRTLSVDVGCVAFKERFFADSEDHRAAYSEAKMTARQSILQLLADSAGKETQPTVATDAWSANRVFGTSGTIESIQAVLNANGWCRGPITRQGLAQLESILMHEYWVFTAGLPGLDPDRVDIFPAGVAILCACFEALEIDQCEYAEVSLLQGMMYQQLGIRMEVNLKQDSVDQLAERFSVDRKQAERVARTALQLYDSCPPGWCDSTHRELLGWAAQLHELGVQINPKHYHRHGAYIVKHAEMLGFSLAQKNMLGLLIRGHRRGMPALAFRALDPEIATSLLRLLALLRLAVILERSHADEDSPTVGLKFSDDQLALDCGPGWLASHPLSASELQVEVQQLLMADIKLALVW